MIAKLLFVVPALLATGALAQQNPRGADPFDNPPPYKEGPGNRGPGMGAGNNPNMFQVEMMRNWLDLIDRYARLSRDPVSSGIAAVVGANDVFRTKPPEQAIEYFTKLLAEVKNEAVQRVIRIQLVDLYTRTNQPDKALEHLRTLMLAAPAGAGGPPPAPSAPEKPAKDKQ